MIDTEFHIQPENKKKKIVIYGLVVLINIVCGIFFVDLRTIVCYFVPVSLVILTILRFTVAKGKKCDVKSDLTGKTVVITGGSAGIGKATALELAKMNARVILACRNEIKSKTCIAQIKRISKNENIEFRHLDLNSFASVRSFVKDWGDQKIDILINNAGVTSPTLQFGQDNYEIHMTVNHLSHFLLTILLLPQIQSRIVNVSSSAYVFSPAKIDWEEHATNKSTSSFNTMFYYGASKLANILFTRELQRRMNIIPEYQKLKTVSLNPGSANTEIIRHSPSTEWLLKLSGIGIFALKNEVEAAQTSLYCAVGPIKGGEFYSECHKVKGSDQSRDKELAKQLWEWSEKCVGDAFPLIQTL